MKKNNTDIEWVIDFIMNGILLPMYKNLPIVYRVLIPILAAILFYLEVFVLYHIVTFIKNIFQ